MMLRMMAAGLAMATTCFGADLEWPEFRGPLGNGIASATHVPVTWSATNNIAWKTPVPEGWSSPIVADKKIYLTGATNMGGGVSLRAPCLDLATGKTEWDVEASHADA